MKPALHHYLVAHTSIFSMCLGAIGAISLLLFGLHSEGALVPDFWAWIWILFAVILAGSIGFILGVVFIWGFLSHIAARIQGWPFNIGDEIVILTGKHKNIETTIYEVWKERGQVRVDLGKELSCAVEDVFCAVEVCRKRRPNQKIDRTGEPPARSS